MKLVALILVAFVLSGCGVDNRERIAMTTLYPDDAPASQVKTPVRPFPALTGALNSKFPLGSDLDGLKGYVAKLSGSCEQSKLGQPMICSFIENGTICIRTTVSITAKTNSLNKIESIDAVRILEGC